MPKYTTHSLSLTQDEEAKYTRVKTATGFGVKKIFMAMIDTLDGDSEGLLGGQATSRHPLEEEE